MSVPKKLFLWDLQYCKKCTTLHPRVITWVKATWKRTQLDKSGRCCCCSPSLEENQERVHIPNTSRRSVFPVGVSGSQYQVSLSCLDRDSPGTWKASVIGHIPRNQDTTFLPSLMQCRGWDKRPNFPGAKACSDLCFPCPTHHINKQVPRLQLGYGENTGISSSATFVLVLKEFPGRSNSPYGLLLQSYASLGTSNGPL